jgi:ABC-type oligopeptide transport system ATPase subunit
VIANALVTQPRLTIADESVSALEVSIRAQILKSDKKLKQELNLRGAVMD